MKRALLLCGLLAACAPASGGGTTRLTSDGSSIAVDGEVPLRGLVIDLTWQTGDEGVEVTDVIPGAGAARLDIFAHDRPGLLYTIARTLYSLDASVVLAKISTHFDQVVDVFYVAETNGGKIRQSLRLKLIRETLISEIAAFEERSAGE